MRKIFTLLILLLLLPVTALAAGEHDSHSNNWMEFTAGTTTLSGGSYYLSGDVEYSGTEITVSGEVILCLNGHKLNLNKQHISVGSGASLTLCDCSTGGVLTGGSGRNGGGVYVGGGTFTMTGGSIAGNTANAGGGVYVDEGGTFTMEDGSINNNQVTSGGGGGVMVNKGSFTLSGGSITGNATSDATYGYGGGVCLYGTFNLSGDAIIQNNTKAGATDNLYLGWNTINITGPLGENAHIGVNAEGVNAEGVPRTFISRWSNNMAGENPADYFSSDGDALGIGLNADGNVVLGSLCTTITLDPNGGTLPEYSLVAGAALPIPTKTGYTFAGWYEKEDLSGDPVTEIPSYAVGDKQYWAKWTANTYTVTFEANGGTGSMDDQTFTYGEEKALTENTFTRTGYTFAGWNTQADGNGTSYADGEELSLTDNLTLYALWTINAYKITAQVANGCEGMGEVIGGGTYKYGTTVTLTATANSGYRFVEWEDGETSATRKITVEGNATYTAKFEQYYPVTNITLDKTELSLYTEGSETLTATIEPDNATNKNVTWSSNNEAVATVDNGKVTAVKEGTATITVTAQDGSGVSASCSVTVTHSMVHTPKKDATCTEDGNIEYWYCKNCDKYFSDENATEELSDVVIPATGHHYVNGYCTECGQRDPNYVDPISYYNIYIEDVCDGVEVTTSKNVVREGGSVSVYVKKDTVNYTFDNFKVYYKRSYYGTWEELKEGTQPGEYPINNIWTHIYIKAQGAEEKEDPTGIESIEGVKVYTKDGSLYVQTPQREQVIIVSMSGAVVKNEEQIGLKQYHGLQPGIYIVRVGDKAYKLRLN